MKNRKALLIISVLFISLTTMGQNQESNVTSVISSGTNVSIQRSITLEDDSQTEEIIIDIKKGTQQYALLINSRVSNGTLTIEVYDPSGEKKENFTISTQLSSDKKEMVSGNINKVLTDPEAGKWKILIVPTNVTGKIRISTSIIE